MSELIPFPGKTTRRRKRIDNMLVERLDTPTMHTDIGQATFTCASCNHAGSFDFTNIIFKNIEFFCSNCGASYRLSNPMFARPNLICK
jgi:transcription elongation factor Elf1